MNDLIKFNNFEDEIIDNTPIYYKKDHNIRKSIFINTNYLTY